MSTQNQFKTCLNDIEPSSTTKANAQKAHKGCATSCGGTRSSRSSSTTSS